MGDAGGRRVLGSIFAGRPFTLQYAKERVAPEVAGLPAFTAAAGTVVILAALAAAAWFTAWLPKAAKR